MSLERRILEDLAARRVDAASYLMPRDLERTPTGYRLTLSVAVDSGALMDPSRPSRTFHQLLAENTENECRVEGFGVVAFKPPEAGAPWSYYAQDTTTGEYRYSGSRTTPDDFYYSGASHKHQHLAAPRADQATDPKESSECRSSRAPRDPT